MQQENETCGGRTEDLTPTRANVAQGILRLIFLLLSETVFQVYWLHIFPLLIAVKRGYHLPAAVTAQLQVNIDVCDVLRVLLLLRICVDVWCCIFCFTMCFLKMHFTRCNIEKTSLKIKVKDLK